jgi:hypothetical protein
MLQCNLTDAELIEALRKAASIWLKNTDLLLLEEFIRRYQRQGSPNAKSSEPSIR